MPVTNQFSGWLMLVLFSGECSTYRTVSPPGMDAAQNPDTEIDAPPAAEVGNDIRVVLLNEIPFIEKRIGQRARSDLAFLFLVGVVLAVCVVSMIVDPLPW